MRSDSRRLNATILASGVWLHPKDYSSLILVKKTNHEMALNGNMRDENLSSMPYPKQMELLTKFAKRTSTALISCGGASRFHSRLHAAILRPEQRYTQGSG